ncbi:MAG: 4'-phosphopantetheinyl transferase superfamily protein [Lachnospiraceae bacterium]|nr:4'-phosphopantetheinyl transferase superfamily protein [Lachnospiraceae bacterium]
MGISIYIADMRRLPLAEQYEHILACLPEEDRVKSQRFIRQEDRIRSAVGALLIRRGVEAELAKRGLLNPQLDEFLHSDHHSLDDSMRMYNIVKNEYGKPYVEEYPDIHFSLSHSGEMIVYAKSDKSLGIDVEKICDIDITEFESYLTKIDKRLLESSIDTDNFEVSLSVKKRQITSTALSKKLVQFYRIWTIREAFAKKVGIGLSVFDNDDVNIDYDNERIIFHGKELMYRTFLADDHIISLCADSISNGLKPHFITRKEWNDYY